MTIIRPRDRLAAFWRRVYAVPYLIEVVILAAMLACVCFLGGCGDRATVKAAIMVDQNLQAQQQLIQEEAAKIPLERDVNALLVRLFDMSATARALQQPVIGYLDVGRGIVPTTTVDQAVHDWPGFKAAAAVVIPEAQIEAEAATWWGQVWRSAAQYLVTLSSSSLSMGLIGGGGTLLTTALGALAVTSRSKAKLLGTALEHAVTYGKDLVEEFGEAIPEAKLDEFNAEAKKSQVDAGVHALIAPLVKA